MANAVIFRLTKPTIDVIGWEADAAVSGSVALALPVFSLGAGNIEGTRLTIAPTLAVTGLVGNVTTAFQNSLPVPAPQLAVTGINGVAGSVVMALPTLQVTAYSASRTVLQLPPPVLLATAATGAIGTVAMSLPAPAVVAQAQVPFVARVALEVAPELAIAGATGAYGSAGLVLRSSLQAAGTTQYAASADLSLRPALTVVGATGAYGSVGLSLRPALNAVASVPFVADAALRVVPTLEIAGATGVSGSVAATLRRVVLAAEGRTGVVGSAVLTLPVVGLSAAGYRNVVGTVDLVVPLARLVASGAAAAAGLSEGTAYVLNLDSQALTQYTNYGFNSMAQFNGVYLGASEAGIFALAGVDDAGVAIDAVARVGISDFGTPQIKRIMRAYVGYKSDGELELRVITDETQTRRYRLASSGKVGLHGGRVQIGQGVEARYWQFEIANVGGADFTLNCVEVSPSRMGRRVQGSGT